MRRFLFPFSCVVFFSFLAGPVGAQNSPEIERVLKLAFENNPSLAEASLGIQQADANLVSQQALYPWTLNANTGFRFDEQPTEDAIQSGVRTSTIFQGYVEILKQFTVGTRLNVRFDLNRNLSKVPINLPQFNINQIQTIGPNYGTSLSATVNQPLLRGFGTRLYTLPIEGARQQKSVAELTEIRAQQDVVANVLRNYWAYVRATWDLEAAKDQLGRADYYKEITDAQIQAGTVAPLQREIVKQRTLAAEQAILVARASLADREEDLRESIGVKDTVEINVSTDLPEIRPPTLEESLESAFKQSPDVQLLEAEVAANRLAVQQSEDAVKPQLDGVATIAQLGLSEDLDESLAQVGTFDFTTFFIGLNFTMPIGNKNARYKLSADRVNVLRSEKRRDIARDQVAAQIRKAHRLVMLQAERRKLSAEEIVLAKTNLDATREQYEAGLTSYSEMRTLETELQDAQLRDRQSKAEYIQSIIALRRLDGTLFEAFGISREK